MAPSRLALVAWIAALALCSCSQDEGARVSFRPRPDPPAEQGDGRSDDAPTAETFEWRPFVPAFVDTDSQGGRENVTITVVDDAGHPIENLRVEARSRDFRGEMNRIIDGDGRRA
jgi:hypothetical protein